MDMENLEVGTRVVISQPGVWMDGTPCTIARSYEIRFGHRMYDLTTSWGNDLTYYAPYQLKVSE